MEKLHITAKRGTWLWCLHCERAYQAGEYIKINGLQMCPYEGCDGSTFMDGWTWNRIKQDHKEYPKVPVKGVYYPLY